MDIEQLKLILETLEAAGEGAFWIALLWIGKGYFLGTLFAAVFITFVGLGYKLIKRNIDACTDEAQFRGIVEDAANLSRGSYTDSYIIEAFHQKFKKPKS